MNKDHQMALEDYLVIYKGVHPDEAINAQMKDIDVDKIVLIYGHEVNQKEVIIDLNPEMKGLQEARTRLVLMAKESAERRGFSHIRIKEYLHPSAIQTVIFLISAVGMISLGFFKGFCLNFFPKYSQQIEILSFYLYYLNCSIAVIHIVEATLFLLPELQKYRVPTKVSIAWFIDCLLLGVFSIARFNSLKPKKN